MNIAVFCKSAKEALMIGKNLGRVEIAATIPGSIELDVPEKMNKAISQANSIGYIKVADDENTYIFTWLADEEMALDLIGDGKMCFEYHGMKAILSNTRQAETVKNILSNPDNAVIYNCAPLPLFAKVYHYIDSRKKFQNVTVNELSEDAVKTAFTQAEEYAGSLRSFLTEITAQKAFWIASYNLPKAIQASLPDAFSLGYMETLLLRLLVKRNDEITNFKGQSSYAVLGEFTTASGECFAAKSKSVEHDRKEDALKFIATLPETVEVIDYKKTTASIAPSGLPNYQSMISICHKEFGYTQTVTQTALHELYSRGFITSPETKGTQFPLNGQREILEILKKYRGSRTFSAKLETFTDDDFNIPIYMIGKESEHGILPTTQVIKQPRTEEMLNVYTVIVREALKCILPNQQIKRNNILLAAGSTLFSASGSTLISKGFTALDEGKSYINDIPENIEVGDALKASYSVRIVQKSAKPHYTEKELFKLLFDCSNGMIPIQDISKSLQDLQDKNLIIKRKKNLIPSNEAVRFIHSMLPAEDIFTLETLSLWYDIFRRIKNAKSITEAETISHNGLDNICLTVKDVCTQMESVMGEATEIPCPTCFGLVRKTKDRYFCTTCGFTANTIYRGKYLPPNNLKYLIKHRTSPLIDGFEFGQGRFCMNEKNEIHISEHLEDLCPICRKIPMAINNKDQKFDCENSTCKFSIPMSLLDHKFTHNEISSLIKEYRTGIIQDAVSRGGKIRGYFFIAKDKTIKFKKL